MSWPSSGHSPRRRRARRRGGFGSNEERALSQAHLNLLPEGGRLPRRARHRRRQARPRQRSSLPRAPRKAHRRAPPRRLREHAQPRVQRARPRRDEDDQAPGHRSDDGGAEPHPPADPAAGRPRPLRFRRRGVRRAGRAMIPPVGFAIAAMTVMLWILWSDSIRSRRASQAMYAVRVATYLVVSGVLILNRVRYPRYFSGGATAAVALAVLVGLFGAFWFARRLVRRI